MILVEFFGGPADGDKAWVDIVAPNMIYVRAGHRYEFRSGACYHMDQEEG